MPSDLLAGAFEQAERSDAPVRAAAFMRIARVQTACEPAKARQTFEQGLEAARRLSSPDSGLLLEHARLIAAAVAPDLLSEIHPSGCIPRDFLASRLSRVMLEHGHVDEAVSYLLHYDDSTSFPFLEIPALMRALADEEHRMAVLRRAVEVWRTGLDRHFGVWFIFVFRTQWKVLPRDEALLVVRDIVRTLHDRPDTPFNATYDSEGTVRITSRRDDELFQIIHILRELDPPLAESVIADHQQLAIAVRRFPNGMESVIAEAAARNSARGSGGGSFCFSGEPRDFQLLESLTQASRDGDFGPPIRLAVERYLEDGVPDNPTPSEFRPSTWDFSNILYQAGKRLGREAAVYLVSIPDDDVRLLAQIELAAALAGLPELQGVMRQWSARPGASPGRGY